jgi:hypothetical protein
MKNKKALAVIVLSFLVSTNVFSQENNQSSFDVLKSMEKTTDKIYLDYFRYVKERYWKEIKAINEERAYGHIWKSPNDIWLDYSGFTLYLRTEATSDPTRQAIDKAVAEAELRGENKYKAYSDAVDAERDKFDKAVKDLYQVLRDKYGNEYSGLGWSFQDLDYFYIDALQPLIETAKDPQLVKEHIAAARLYSNLFNVSFGNAFLNLDEYKTKRDEENKKWEQMKVAQERNKKIKGVIIPLGIALLVLTVPILLKSKRKKSVENPSVSKSNYSNLKNESNPATNIPNTSSKFIDADELIKYNNLLKVGAITQEEYDKIKNKFLERSLS